MYFIRVVNDNRGALDNFAQHILHYFVNLCYSSFIPCIPVCVLCLVAHIILVMFSAFVLFPVLHGFHGCGFHVYVDKELYILFVT